MIQKARLKKLFAKFAGRYAPLLQISDFRTHKTVSHCRQQPLAATVPPVVLVAGCANTVFTACSSEQIASLFQYAQIPVMVDTTNCCGAIVSRTGNLKLARKKLAKLHKDYPNQWLVFQNSSCAAHYLELSKYSTKNNHSTNSMADTTDLARKTAYDVVAVIIEQYWQEFSAIRFRPLAETILVHHSCSVRNKMKIAASFEKVLSLIPEIRIVKGLDQGCCGAGGDNMFDYPELAAAIARDYVQKIMAQRVKILVSSDISCSIHLQQQLVKEGYHLEVLHPLALLQRQLPVSADDKKEVI